MPSADAFLHQSIAQLVAVRRAHEEGDLDGQATLAHMVAAIAPALRSAAALGLGAEAAQGVAQVLAQLADHWMDAYRRGTSAAAAPGAEEDPRGAFWRHHHVARELFGQGGQGEHFTAALARTRADADPTLVRAWAAALALGCRGGLRASEAARLSAQLIPAGPTHALPSALLGTAALPARQRQGRAVWLPAGLAMLAAVAALLWMAARAELAAVVGQG